jgi:inhibitor of cysteine peptidase
MGREFDMKRILAFALVAALALGLVACSSGSASSSGGSPATVAVTQADQGKTVSAKPGDTIVVSLEGNPSTGYTWVAKDLPSFLTQEGEPTFKQADSSGAVGAPGMVDISFKATAAGSGELKLDYVRPWETTATPVKTFSANVDVK